MIVNKRIFDGFVKAKKETVMLGINGGISFNDSYNEEHFKISRDEYTECLNILNDEFGMFPPSIDELKLSDFKKQ